MKLNNWICLILFWVSCVYINFTLGPALREQNGNTRSVKLGEALFLVFTAPISGPTCLFIYTIEHDVFDKCVINCEYKVHE